MSIRYLLASVALLACIACSPAPGQPGSDPRQAAVDALFADVAVPGSPGAAISVYHHGKLILAKGYGLADVEAGTPITAQTPFHVASVSKQFTAFAIALLARDGKVDLDADIRTYLPYMPDFGHVITVRHLILHTSGLRDQWNLFMLSGRGLDDRLYQQQIVNMVSHQQTLNFTPGTDHLYCNTGYTLLAEIVRATSGKSLRDFAHERIFKPLGMDRTFFLDDANEVVPGRANSYGKEAVDDSHAWKRKLLNLQTAGATSLHTTVEDMAKWAANFTQPVVGDRRLIEQISHNGTLDDGKPIAYGFGLERRAVRQHTVVTHDGVDAGFRAQFVYYPDEDFAITVLANTDVDVHGKAADVADIYLPKLPQPAVVEPAAVDTTTNPAFLAGIYVTPYSRTMRLEMKEGALIRTDFPGQPRKAVLRVDGSFDFGEPLLHFLKPVRDTGGHVIAIEETYARETGTLVHTRGEPADLDMAKLAQYTGDYRSAELGITYRVEAVSGQLTIRSLWTLEPIVLRPSIADRFDSTVWWLGMLQFERDGQGRITGLLSQAGRARNVRLERIN